MVTLSIGGNDVGFSKIVDSCVFQYWRKESDCGPDLAEAERLINGIDNTLVAVYSTILRKVQDSGGRPNFKLIVTGTFSPLLFVYLADISRLPYIFQFGDT